MTHATMERGAMENPEKRSPCLQAPSGAEEGGIDDGPWVVPSGEGHIFRRPGVHEHRCGLATWPMICRRSQQSRNPAVASAPRDPQAEVPDFRSSQEPHVFSEERSPTAGNPERPGSAQENQKPMERGAIQNLKRLTPAWASVFEEERAFFWEDMDIGHGC